ncbi:MAG: glycosyltransferase family 4 protein [Armatimonadota bacterium]
MTVQVHMMMSGLESEGAEVLRIDTILHKLDKKLLLPLRILLQPLATMMRFLRDAPKSDVVHIHAASWWGFVPVMVCAPLNRCIVHKRLVISFHGGAGHIWLKRYARIAIPFFRMVDKTVVVSPQLKMAFKEYGIEADILWNLVDVVKFPFRERREIKPRIVWIRHLEETYDPMAALRVFEIVSSEVPGSTITFIGDGTLRQEMERYIDEHGLTGVRFTGRLPNSEVAGEFEKADIFLNTSRRDGMPTALLEASAAGLLIVTTDAGGIPAMIENGRNGIVVPVGDANALAREVVALISDYGRACAIGRAARLNAEKYDWKARRTDLAKLYDFVDNSGDSA